MIASGLAKECRRPVPRARSRGARIGDAGADVRGAELPLSRWPGGGFIGGRIGFLNHSAKFIFTSITVLLLIIKIVLNVCIV